jgi:hypothetical protein
MRMMARYCIIIIVISLEIDLETLPYRRELFNFDIQDSDAANLCLYLDGWTYDYFSLSTLSEFHHERDENDKCLSAHEVRLLIYLFHPGLYFHLGRDNPLRWFAKCGATVVLRIEEAAMTSTGATSHAYPGNCCSLKELSRDPILERSSARMTPVQCH